MTGPRASENRGWPWLGDYERHPRLYAARPVIGERAMISTPHHLATAIGMEVLRSGGNAVDAAVAASAALMVTVPMQCSPGGDAIWITRKPDGEVSVLDASGRSPMAADPESLRSRGLTSIPARSAEAVTVPGAVDGWVRALERHGTRGLEELLEPAARLAESGFFVSRHLHASFRAAWPSLEARGATGLWSSSHAVPAIYDRLQQPPLAQALRQIGRSQGREFYEGSLARDIVAAAHNAGSPLSHDDLARHRAEWLRPLKSRWGGLTLYTSPPSTQGVALLEALGLLESLGRGHDPDSEQATHLMIEALAAALEERDRFVGDRSRMLIGPESLYGDVHLDLIAATIDPARAGERTGDGGPTKGRGDTAHLAVVDSDGLAVSLIQSVFFDFGTGIPVPSGGFTLQNRGAAFRLQAGHVGELGPGLHPPHTLAPTIACENGRLRYVLGCMGGDGQVQTQLQLLHGMARQGLDPQQAVSRPRWYLDRSTPPVSQVLAEEGVDAALVDGLRRCGHDVSVLGPAEEIMGHAQIIGVEPRGALVGASDPRSDGQVAGW
jgi:gamma-glutamyltranspeptidase/glutathione hydrolase